MELLSQINKNSFIIKEQEKELQNLLNPAVMQDVSVECNHCGQSQRVLMALNFQNQSERKVFEMILSQLELKLQTVSRQNYNLSLYNQKLVEEKSLLYHDLVKSHEDIERFRQGMKENRLAREGEEQKRWMRD